MTKTVKFILITILSAVVIAVAIFLGVYFGACKKNNAEEPESTVSDNDVYGVGEEGRYYYVNSQSSWYYLSLQSGVYNITIGDDIPTSYTGNYSYDADEGKIYFRGDTQFTATMAGDTLSLDFDGTGYRFLKYVFFDVTFVDDDGDFVCTQSILNGQPAEYVDYEDDDRYFIGWYTDASHSVEYGFNEAVTGSTTIYGRFIAIDASITNYEVTYVYGDGREETVATQNGVIYRLANEDGLLGWWVSATNKADELTYRYEEGEIVLYSDTRLYAVWDGTGVIGTSVTSDGITWENNVSSSITIEIYSEDGQTRYVQAKNISSASKTFVTDDFTSLGTGKYIVVVTQGNYTETRMYIVNGLERVSHFVVTDGILTYDPVAGAEGYYITVECGNENHSHVYVNNGNLLYYDFSACQMTKNGMTFTVYAYADGYCTSESTYTYSLTLGDIIVTVADDAIGWEAVEDASYYEVYINGELIDITKDLSYSLKYYNPGEYIIEVKPVKEGYYSEKNEALTYEKKTLAAPVITGIDNGVISWEPVEGARQYEVSINGSIYSVEGGTSSGFVTSSGNFVAGQGVYEVKVRAIGDYNSLYCDSVFVNENEMGDALTYSSGKVTWQYVLNATEYLVVVNNHEKEYTVHDTNYCEIELTKEGENFISVYFIDSEGNTSVTCAEITVYAYFIALDARGGSIPSSSGTIYVANGDRLSLPDASYSGYVFSGWYTLPDLTNFDSEATPEYSGDGYLYESDSIFARESNLYLYAFYEPYSYNVTLRITGEGYMVDEDGNPVTDETGNYITEATVVLYSGRNFTLPKVVSTNGLDIFSGWQDDPGTAGTVYTDNEGNSVIKWNKNTDSVLYAGFTTMFKMTLTTYKGQSVYAVTKASNSFPTSITEITIPETYNGVTVGVIESTAFTDLKNIRTINIPDTVMYINTTYNGYGSGNGAFAGCSSLREVNIYATGGEKTTRKEIKYYSEDGVLFEYDENSDEVTLVYYPRAKSSTNYSVPETVSNEYEIDMSGADVVRPVTSIAIKVFHQNTSIETITIPATVTNIYTQAFYACTSLVEVVMLSTTRFGEIPAATTLHIAEGAFRGCSSLTSVTLASRLDADCVICEVFTDCKNLVDVSVNSTGDSSIDNFSSCDGVLLSADGRTLVYYPLGRDAFDISSVYNSSIYVTEIAAYAVYGNIYVTEATIPRQIQKIGESAFQGCSKLEKLTFESLDYLDAAGLTICTNAFYGCTSLTEVAVPQNTVTIEAYAFGGCTKLLTVSYDAVPGTANLNYADRAFGTSQGVYSVKYLTIGQYAPVIDIVAVFGENIGSVTIAEGNENYWQGDDQIIYDKDKTEIIYCPSDYSGSVTIPDTVESIGSNVFKGRNITSIYIPASVHSVGASAFEGCRYLECVVFESPTNTSLTIGDAAFSGCVRLEHVTLPVGLLSIGASAFEGCSKLTSLAIPEGVETIGEKAFYNCYALESLQISSTVSAIGSEEYGVYNVFYGCRALTSVTIDSDNHYFVIDDGILYGLTVVNGQSVKSVLYMAMEAAEGELTVDGTVEKIMYRAFYGNEKITKITFQTLSGALDIASEAFYGCKGLTSVVLPEGLTSVGDKLFADCENLASVTVPASVTGMGLAVFDGCASLETVVFTEGGTEELKLSAGYEDAFGVTSVFSGSSIKTVSLPERVKSIPQYTFYGLDSVTSVTVPASVETIGAHAFAYCTNLTNVTFASESLLSSIGTGAFEKSGITSIALPERFTSLSAGAASVNGSDATPGVFQDCASLVTVTIPSALTNIPAYTFYRCTSLLSVTCSDGDASGAVAAIGERAFSSCTSLVEVSVSEEGLYEIGSYAFYNTKIETITLSDSLESVPEYAFYGTGIQTLTIPSHLMSIGAYAFSESSSLGSVSVAADVNGKSLLETISTRAFYGCASLSSFTFECSLCALSSIGEEAFALTALKSFAFPECEGALTLGKSLFSGCESLTSVTLSGSVQDITDVFTGCSGITSVTVAEGNVYFKTSTINGTGVTLLLNPTGDTLRHAFGLGSTNGVLDLTNETYLKEIGDYAFLQNDDLVEITIPYTVTRVGTNAFVCCEKLEKVTFVALPEGYKDGGAVEYGYQIEFVAGTSNIITTGGYDSRYTYGTFAGSEALKEVTLPDRMSVVPSRMFESCTYLERLVIPACVETVGEYALFHAGDADDAGDLSVEFEANGAGSSLTTLASEAFAYTGIRQITLPASLTSISATGVFQGSSSLESVTFSASSLELTGSNLFYNCASLKSVTLPGGVTSYPSNMFYGCSSLEFFVIPYTVTSIGTGAFSGCTSLKSIVFEAVPGSANDEYVLTIADGTSDTTGAFSRCVSLTSFCVPTRLSAVPAYAFAGCTSLVAVTYEDDASYDADNDYSSEGYFATRSGLKINDYAFTNTGLKYGDISCAGEVGGYMFANCSSLTKVIVSENTNNIPTGLVSGCSAVTEFTIPDTVTYLGGASFQGTSISTITLPAGITDIHSSTFANCVNLSEVIVEGEITYISDNAFYGCVNLEYFDLSHLTSFSASGAFAGSGLKEADISGITSISASVFSDCANLETVKISSSLTSIGSSAFKNCVSLTQIYYEGYIDDGYDEGTSAFPSTLTTISSQAFYNCGITEINIPGTVTSISNGSISGTTVTGGPFACSALETVTICEGVQTIGNCMFYGCENLKNVYIPYTVTTIGYGAFCGCSSLESVVFGDVPASLAESDYPLVIYGGSGTNNGYELYGAFSGCSSLVEITLPERTTRMGTCMFYECTSLEYFVIPSGVTVINGSTSATGTSSTSVHTFYGCTSLKEVVFSYGVTFTSVGLHMFEYCSSLESVVLPDTVTKIDEYTFHGCSSLTGITIPDSVATISVHAFESSGLEEVYIPKNVSSITTEAFSYCTSLTNFTVDPANTTFHSKDGVIYTTRSGAIKYYPGGRSGDVVLDDSASLESYAFTGCDKITSVTLGAGCTSVSSHAFEDCVSLKYIVVTNSTTQFSTYSLEGCTSLEAIYYMGTDEEWGSVTFGNNNDVALSAPVYFYSESEPEEDASGAYIRDDLWHYSDGEIVIWTEPSRSDPD